MLQRLTPIREDINEVLNRRDVINFIGRLATSDRGRGRARGSGGGWRTPAAYAVRVNALAQWELTQLLAPDRWPM
jgi:hypothetical protein